MSVATEIQRLQTAKANIKNAIEQKGVTVGDGTIDTYAEKISEISGGGSGDYDQGYEDGKNSVVPFERNAKELVLNDLNAFGKEDLVLNLDNATTLNSLCRSFATETDNTTVKHLTINCLQPLTNISQILSATTSGDYILEQITFNYNTIIATSVTYMLANLRALKVIDGKPLDFSSMTSISTATFSNCPALEEVRFAPNSIFVKFVFNTSAVLSDETRQSVIDGLADLTGGTAQTLTVHKNVGEKMTDTQKATITAKNWTLVY